MKRPTIASLTAELNKLTAELDEAKAERKSAAEQRQTYYRLSEERAAAVREFKQDVLRLTTENAELRGYLTRTLEDDAVREIGPVAEPAGMTDQDRNTKHDIIERQYRDAQPARSVRQGPLAQPLNQEVDEAFRSMSYGASVAKPAPKHWMDR